MTQQDRADVVTRTEAAIELGPEVSSGRRYAVEAVGTFFLVFTVGCTVLAASPLAPLAIGSALMVMVYAGGHISGGHFNPAVSLGAVVRGRLATADLAPYWAAQLIGAALAAVAATYVTDKHPAAHGLASLPAAAVAEFLMTFALVWVVLNVATAAKNEGNGFYGLAIGFTVMVGAVAVGGISGGAFNPAVGLGAAMMGLATWSTAAMYIARFDEFLGWLDGALARVHELDEYVRDRGQTDLATVLAADPDAVTPPVVNEDAVWEVAAAFDGRMLRLLRVVTAELTSGLDTGVC